jgi:hypothetical protein
MAGLQDLYKQRKAHLARLQQRELQQATYGISADPSIPNEINDIRSNLAELESKILQAWSSLLKRYEHGVSRFAGSLDRHNPYRDQALDCQKRVRDLIVSASQDDDFEAIAAEREQLVQLINDLALKTTGATLEDFVAHSTHSDQNGGPKTRADSERPPHVSTTTNVYGSVGSMHTGTGDIYVTNPSEPAANQLDLQFALLRRGVSQRAANHDLVAKGQRKLDDLRDAIHQADIEELSAAVAWLRKHVSLGSELAEFFRDPSVYATLRSTFPGAAEELIRRVGSSK